MSHLGTIKKSNAVKPEWLLVNGQVGTLVNKWAHRDDLIAHLSDDAGRGEAPALFDPYLGEIEINTTAAFGDVRPRYIGDLNERAIQFEFPKGSGAIFHEACHARYTTWDLKHAARTLTPSQNDALHLLEEGRIEALGVKNDPKNTAFLRSCALEIVFADMTSEKVKKLSGVRQAIHLAGLALGRVDAGVLQKSDVKQITKMINTQIKPEHLKDLRQIWREFQQITNPAIRIQRMYELAIRWDNLTNELAKEDDKKDQERREQGQGQPGSGGGGGMSQEEFDALPEFMKELIKAMAQIKGQSEIEAQSDVNDQEQVEERQAEAEAEAERQKEEAESKQAAKQVFSENKQTPVNASSGSQLSYQETNSGVARRRPPTDDERGAAITVGRALEKAKYHDRIKIESNSVLPPGRMRTRAIVQKAAYKARGQHTQVEPFRRVQRKHEIDPNLTVGVMTDISGSMGGAMEPMGVTGWVMAEAVSRIQGTLAMVNYGYSVTPTMYPGDRPRDITIYSAPDGSEAFSHAFKALDGELNLLNGSGARLLVIVSDGNYKGGEIQSPLKYLKRCKDEGVAVIWLGYASAYGAQRYCEQTEAVFVAPGKDPAETALLVGKAATEALTRAGASRA